jgi:competence protein ComEA
VRAAAGEDLLNRHNQFPSDAAGRSATAVGSRRAVMRRLSFVVAMFVVLATMGGTAAEGQAKGSSKAAAAITTPININTATAAQLEALPGIGARTAQAIVDHRQKNGGFKKIEELMNVKGIGEKSFLKLKPMVTVSVDKAEKAGDR